MLLRTTILSLVFVLLTVAGAASVPDSVITIQQCIDDGLVSYTLKGRFDAQSKEHLIDNNGVHYGKCMELAIRNKMDSTITVLVPNGILLVPDDTTFQVMVNTRSFYLELKPRAASLTRFYAMCTEIHKGAPYSLTGFIFGEMANFNLLRLCERIAATDMQNRAGQHAVWALTDQVDSTELLKFGASAITLKQSTKLLQETGNLTLISPHVSEESATAPPVDDSVREENIRLKQQVNKVTTILYGVGSIAVILLIAAGGLLMRNRKLTRTTRKDKNL